MQGPLPTSGPRAFGLHPPISLKTLEMLRTSTAYLFHPSKTPAPAPACTTLTVSHHPLSTLEPPRLCPACRGSQLPHQGHQQKGIKGFTCQSHTGPETIPRHLIQTVRQGFRPCSPRGSTLPFAASHSSLQTVYTKQQLK